MKRTYEEIQKEIEALTQAIRELKNKRNYAAAALKVCVTDFEYGDRIRNIRTGEEFFFNQVECVFAKDDYTIYGNKIKKDGKPYQDKVYLGDHTAFEKVVPEGGKQ